MEAHESGLSAGEIATVREMIAVWVENRRREQRRHQLYGQLFVNGRATSTLVLSVLQIVMILLLLSGYKP